MATLAASLLTLVSICLLSLGIWRLSQDLDLAGDFIFPDGVLSHWQVWIAAAAAVQYSCWRLTRYAKQAHAHPETPLAAPIVASEALEEKPHASSIAANV